MLIAIKSNKQQAASPLLAVVALFLAISAINLRPSESLRTGAPSIACLNLRPFHGLHRPKPASASQFFVTQSSYSYLPNQTVTVEIVTHSSERYFRGFLIQAYDPISGQQIGRFLPTDESRTLDGCSAATHRNNINKKHISLTWFPPHSLPSVAIENPIAVASQWLGLQTNSASAANNNQPSSSSLDVMPEPPQPLQADATSLIVSNQKRQLSNGAAADSTAGAGLMNANSANNNGSGSSTQLRQKQQQQPRLRQVRFRATIVVTYEEFYTGFESSDQRFEKFDYANVERSATNKPTINNNNSS